LEQSIPSPVRPSNAKIVQFESCPQALKTLAGCRPDIDSKSSDPWHRTRSYVMAIAYRGLKSGFSVPECLWYVGPFLKAHAPADFGEFDLDALWACVETEKDLWLGVDGFERFIRLHFEFVVFA
jgi:hypothetical protein